MSAPTTVLWSLEDHTRAKHEILRRYLQAWFPIMSKYNERIIYLDGFAGPGEYIGGEPGSPVIALDTWLNHSYKSLHARDIRFLFIEQDLARYQHLKQLLARRFPKNIRYQVFAGNFDETMTILLDQLEERQTRLAPTFAFIDPFGYSHTPMRTVQRLMSHPQCEVLITFMYDELNRFLTADYRGKEQQYTDLFGTTEWQKIASGAVDSTTRRNSLHDLYLNQLKRQAGARYVRSFCMRNRHNSTDYFLFFATKNLLGMKKMKEAMAKVDPSCTYLFSDFTDPNQMQFFNEPNYAELRRLLGQHFKGRTVSIKEIEAYVIADTPFYKYKAEALKEMEENLQITVSSTNPKRERGTYAEGKTNIRFL